MADPRYVLSIGLAGATLAVVLPFLQGVLAAVPGFVPAVAQSGLAPALSLWFGPVIPLMAVALAAAAFAVSWRRRSFLVAGLLAASGIVFAVTSMIATEFFAVVAVPGPILGVLFGLAIFALGAAKGVMSAKRVQTVPAR
jgi:hypothetical protein